MGKYICEKCGHKGYYFDPSKRPRSNEQRKYYFGVIVKMLAEEIGYTIDEMHESIKLEFLRIPGKDGKPDRIGSTKDFSSQDQEQFNDCVREWAMAEFNVKIPLPNECELPENIFY